MRCKLAPKNARQQRVKLVFNTLNLGKLNTSLNYSIKMCTNCSEISGKYTGAR